MIEPTSPLHLVRLVSLGSKPNWLADIGADVGE
jgi:hypothetical protein